MKNKVPTMVYIEPEILEVIDDYRYKNRIRSRSTVILQLIHLALEHVEQEQNKDSSEGTT